MITIPKASKLPSGNWRIQMNVKGQKYSITAPTKRECESAARAKKQWLMDNYVPTELTVGQAIDRYINNRTNVTSPTTIAAYRSYRRNHFLTVMDTPIRLVDDWQSLINEEAVNCSPKTLKNVWGLISPVITSCGIREPKVTLPKYIVKEIEFLEPDMIHPFLDAIHDDRHEVPYLLALHSLRLSEVIAMSRDKIAGGKLLVHGARLKTPQGMIYRELNKTDTSRREIKILIPRLQELIDGYEWNNLSERNSEIYSKHLKTICKKNDFPIITMHCLRHTFCTLCFNEHIDPYDTMRLGGWKDFNTVMRHYRHLADAERKESEDILSSFYEKS